MSEQTKSRYEIHEDDIGAAITRLVRSYRAEHGEMEIAVVCWDGTRVSITGGTPTARMRKRIVDYCECGWPVILKDNGPTCTGCDKAHPNATERAS